MVECVLACSMDEASACPRRLRRPCVSRVDQHTKSRSDPSAEQKSVVQLLVQEIPEVTGERTKKVPHPKIQWAPRVYPGTPNEF